MGGSKQLSDKAHRDGSPTRRNRPEDVKKSLDPMVVHVEDKQVISEMRKISSVKKSEATPMKMLIAQEMCKETELTRKQPNIVARLMGLDEALPAYQPVLYREGHFEKSVRSLRALHNRQQREDSYFDMSRPWEVRSCSHENQTEARMALIRQKFMEEPSSIFSKDLKEFHPTPAAPQPKKITLLKPSKSVEMKNDIQVKRQRASTTQPTRIVVLKPSPGKDISQQTRESLSGIRRDESLLSSVHSNGYVGDESSVNSFSDSETPSPTSPHYWDNFNRFGSPRPISSFSRASYSPKKSVASEAKKQLSERWFMLASNGNSKEQMEVQRSSSILGKMLSITEVKKEAMSTCEMKDGDVVERSPVNLSRSKSLPVCSASEKIGLKFKVANAQAENSVAKNTSKSKSGKSSFKGKISSLFFSKNKKRHKGEPVGEEDGDLLHPISNIQPESFTRVSVNPKEESIDEEGSTKHGIIPLRAVLSIDKTSTPESSSDSQRNPCLSDKVGENQNQPSPTSVLDAPFEDDTTNTTPDSSEIQNARRSLTPIESQSVVCSLSLDDTNLELSSPDSMEWQRYSFVESILSAAGLDKNLVFAGWHSVDSPLNPTLMDKFLDPKEEDATKRMRRSNQRLLFDCTNSALLEIGRTSYMSSYPWARKKVPSSASMGDEVWSIVNDWFSACEIDDLNTLVERLVRKEVGGNGWAESMQSEISDLGIEISGQVFEELVSEALTDFTIGCSL